MSKRSVPPRVASKGRSTFVGVYWGGDVLEFRRIAPGASFAWEDRLLVRVAADGRATLCLWDDVDEGSELHLGDDANAVPIAEVRREFGNEVELADGSSFVVRRGALMLGVTQLRGLSKVETRPMPSGEGRRMSRPSGFTLGAGVLVGACLALSAWAKLPAAARADERDREREECARALWTRALEREVEEIAEAPAHQEGGTGARARGAEGGMGQPSRAPSSRYGVPGLDGVALRDRAEFGMVGVLRSGSGGIADAPSSRVIGRGPGNAWGDGGLGSLSHREGGAIGVHPPTDPRVDPVSTFAVDVDTGSYVLARGQLRSGALPKRELVRPEEMLNYFDYGYEGPRESDAAPFEAHLDAAPSPYEDGHWLVRVGLQAKRHDRAARRPAHLVYLVDTSGSMASDDKLPLVKASLRLLTERLRAGDSVALCTYAGWVREVLPPTTIANRQAILDAIDDLSAGGGTAMGSGMEVAYRLAQRGLVKGHINRVIVLSDGDANIGNTQHSEILASIQAYRRQGITLSTVGFGSTRYKDSMMERLADEGDGNYSFVDSVAEARRVFVERVDGLLDVVARDVKLQVAMDGASVKSYRLIGYENRDVADADFRDDGVDGGEVGAGHSVTAVYDVELEPVVLASVRPSWLTLSVRFKAPTGSDEATELAFSLREEHVQTSWEAAPASFRMAVAVAGLAEVLRRSPYATGWSLDAVEQVAATVPRTMDERGELVELVQRAIANSES